MGLYKRKDSPFWWMSFRLEGRRVYESTGTGNKKLADRIHAKRVTELAEGRWFKGGGAERLTLGELIEWYKVKFQPKKKYTARDASIFNHLKKFFGEGAALESLEHSVDGYEAFRRAQVPAPAFGTIVKELGLLRRLCNLAMRKRWLRVNPVSFVEMPRANDERVRYLNPEEVQQLLVILPGWLRPIVTFARNTGLRRENILSLSWAQVDLSGGYVFIAETKNGEPLIAPLNATACKVLEGASRVRRLNSPWVFCDEAGRRFSGDKVGMAFRRACKRAGIANLRFHDLRHDFASRLVQGGVDIYRVKGLLGHRDLRSTSRYAHLSPEHLEAVRVLDEGGGYDSVTLEKAKGA